LWCRADPEPKGISRRRVVRLVEAGGIVRSKYLTYLQLTDSKFGTYGNLGSFGGVIARLLHVGLGTKNISPPAKEPSPALAVRKAQTGSLNIEFDILVV
jgi:hypothetical protein